MRAEHLFELSGIDILAHADDHVVAAAADGDIVPRVPRADVVRVEPAVLVTLCRQLRVLRVAERGFIRAKRMISPGVSPSVGDGLVRACIASFVQGHDADLIVRAGRPALPAICGRSSGRRKLFQNVSVVP